MADEDFDESDLEDMEVSTSRSSVLVVCAIAIRMTLGGIMGCKIARE